jgi:hypothetical protein
MNRNSQPRADLLAAMDQRADRLAQRAAEASFCPGGVIELFHNGEQVEISPNLIPAAWRSKLLRAGYQGGAQTSQFYVAPFLNEVDVEALDTLVAADVEATLDEFTGYSEVTRPLWAQDAEANQQIANATTLAKITVTTAATIWGILLMTVNTKGSSAGDVAAATKFGSGRPVQVGDTLEFKYTMKANLPG